MKIPFSYIFRNLWTRKLTTILTAAGMGLVVFVFAAVLMLDAGLKKTMVGTGSFDNVVMIRKGSETEIQSGVSRDQASLVESMSNIARGPDGKPVVSKESLILISLNKKGQERGSNIVTRGVSPLGLTMRPQAKIIRGRLFREGSSEVIVGRNVNEQFDGAEIGQALRFGGRDWQIVGIFDAQKSAFDSEVWGDVEQLMQSFRRVSFSSVIAQLSRSDGFDKLVADVDDDIRLNLQTKREQIFYEDQSRALSTFITILGTVLSVIFSLGAMIGVPLFGWSIGKLVAHTRVVSARSQRTPSLWRVVVRWVVPYLPVIVSLTVGLDGDLVGLAIAFVYLPIMLDLRGWHDRAGGTLVVEARRSI